MRHHMVEVDAEDDAGHDDHGKPAEHGPPENPSELASLQM